MVPSGRSLSDGVERGISRNTGVPKGRSLSLAVESATAPAHPQGPPQNGRARLQPGHKDAAPKEPTLLPQARVKPQA
jgi:hypothetical protein